MAQSNLPSGTVTFLFTDIEGSTRLWQEKPEAMAVSHARHDAILREAIESNHGIIFQNVGDSFNAAFSNALDGLSAALTAQRRLQSEPWGETGAIRVRMGIHTGAAKISDVGSNQYQEGYTTIASTQRVMSVAHGGQVLFSQTSQDLLQNILPENVALRDLGEHRLKDLRSPLRLYQMIAPDLPQEFPPIQTLNTLPNNLPIQLTHFVGREEELAEVERLLSETRLLTLTGPGGTGKTRLELQAAAAVLEEFPQGAWLVELAPVNDPQIVVQVVANVFTVRDAPGRSLLEALVDYLRYKKALLILDNCEHLIEACARLADNLLRLCPNLKILASSRESLGIAGEAVFPVPSLSLPSKNGSISLADMERSEAVHLFVERARAANPTFRLEDENARAVAAICRRLDGIPLAIELAAARVKVLPPSQIATRLDDRFRLLTGGSRNVLPHHQTLKALIDWSWALLLESEKILLRRLAIFAGSFNLEAAESICADPDPIPPGQSSVSSYEILDLLEGLVNKSLLVMGEEAGEARYRLLETIRQYALEQLLLSGEISNLRDRHLESFAKLAMDAEPQIKGAGMIEWIDRLGRDSDNLRAALEWGLEHCHPAVLSMTKSLIFYWLVCSLSTEGIHWLESAASCLPTAEPDDSRPNPDPAILQRQAIQAHLLSGAALLAVNLGQNLKAIQFSKEAERWARASGDPNALCFARAMNDLVKANFEEINQQVKADAEENLALARRLGDIWLQCHIVAALARIVARLGDQAAIAGCLQEHARLARQSGNPWQIAANIYFSMLVGQMHGDLPEIRQATEEGIRLFTQLKNRLFTTALRSELAHILRRRGEWAEAQAIYIETIPQWLELGNQAAVAHEIECLAALAVEISQPERAAQLLGAAQALRQRLHSEMDPNERPEYEAVLEEVRLCLDPAALQTAWNKGEAMNLKQAVDFAKNEPIHQG